MATTASGQPNILIVVIDSMRADHVSCYGYHRETTPNIDRLAAEGCLFETAITAAPFSPASYASIFSNLYPHQHGVNGDTVRVWPNGWPRLPEKMQECGYYTFCISNNGFVSEEMNGSRGFEAFAGPKDSWFLKQYSRAASRARRYFGDRLAGLLESNGILCHKKGDSLKSVDSVNELIRRGRRPFFGVMILMDPHVFYNPRRRAFCEDQAQVRKFLKRVNGRHMWSKLMAVRQTLPREQLQAGIDLYDSEIHHADRAIGELYDCLEREGVLDETVLVVAADHGEAFGEHGVWGHGFCLNDCLTRVPLVMRCPRYWPSGTRSAALVQLHDLHQLCTSVSGTGDPEPHRYPNCLTQASDAAWRGRDFVYSEFARQSKTLQFMHDHSPDFTSGLWDHGMWAVRSRDWRYIEYGEAAQEFYDLGNDPLETTPVADPPPTIASTLRHHLGLHRSELTAMQPPERGSMKEGVDEVVYERLRALGYLE